MSPERRVRRYTPPRSPERMPFIGRKESVEIAENFLEEKGWVEELIKRRDALEYQGDESAVLYLQEINVGRKKSVALTLSWDTDHVKKTSRRITVTAWADREIKMTVSGDSSMEQLQEAERLLPSKVALSIPLEADSKYDYLLVREEDLTLPEYIDRVMQIARPAKDEDIEGVSIFEKVRLN